MASLSPVPVQSSCSIIMQLNHYSFICKLLMLVFHHPSPIYLSPTDVHTIGRYIYSTSFFKFFEQPSHIFIPQYTNVRCISECISTPSGANCLWQCNYILTGPCTCYHACSALDLDHTKTCTPSLFLGALHAFTQNKSLCSV